MTSETNNMQWPQFFRASLFWSVNLIAAPIGGIGGFALILLWDFSNGNAPGGWELSLYLTYAIVGLLAYFPGNLNVFWPYAVEVDPRQGITLFGPLKKLRIPISEIGEIEDSLFWQGYVVHLTKPRVALTQFVIPWYFGSERKSIIEVIRAAISTQSG